MIKSVNIFLDEPFVHILKDLKTCGDFIHERLTEALNYFGVTIITDLRYCRLPE